MSDEECQKTKYASKKEATTIKNWRTKGRHKNRRGISEALRVYPCPKCGFWHLTHSVREIQKYHAIRKGKTPFCKKYNPEDVPDEYMMV